MKSGFDSQDLEKDLWQEIKKGNKEAFNCIIYQNYALLFNYGQKIYNDSSTVEDCIQELFIYVWEHRSGLSDVKAVKAYLLLSLRRRLINHLTAWNKKRVHGDSYLTHSELGITFSHEEFVIRNEEKTEVQKRLSSALNNLSDRQKEAIYLKYYSKLSYDEIAKVMEMENQSVANLLRRALQSLRKLYTFIAPIVLQLLE